MKPLGGGGIGWILVSFVLSYVRTVGITVRVLPCVLSFVDKKYDFLKNVWETRLQYPKEDPEAEFRNDLRSGQNR